MWRDARHLAEWWERYDRAKYKYVRGYWTRFEAINELMSLRYRDQALKIELLEFDKARRSFEDLKIANKHRAHLEELEMARRQRELENDERDVTASSSE